MIAIPNNRAELLSLEKENNIIVKLNSTGNLSGLVPAYRKIAKWIGYKDEWQILFVASRQYHTLIDDVVKSSINYDLMMQSLKDTYTDSFGRIAKTFNKEQDAINYLLNDKK